MLILATGATGKVGRNLIARLLEDSRFAGARVRALCHNRLFPESERVEVVRGSIAERDAVSAAIKDVTHIVHLATCKETPDDVMDVTVKGLFWLLEEFRTSPTARQFILIGGDAGVGHYFYRHDGPVTEKTPHMAYPGCYALSKVLEEVMLEQFGVQYDLNGCCLRAPWIMAQDDFKAQLSFGDDVFGGPRWRDLVGAEAADGYIARGAVPVMQDPDGKSVKRNFVHVDDLVDAILLAFDNPAARQQTFNICMDEPVDYGELGAYLASSRGAEQVPIKTPYRSTWLDNSKAKFLLGWRPRYDLRRLVDAAFSYQRAPDDPRKVWYPG